MSLTINILYTGTNGNAKKFAEEMINIGIVDKVRNEVGNKRYEYFFPMDDVESVLLIDEWVDEKALDSHHKTEMMKHISELREKYQLKMKVEKFTHI